MAGLRAGGVPARPARRAGVHLRERVTAWVPDWWGKPEHTVSVLVLCFSFFFRVRSCEIPAARTRYVHPVLVGTILFGTEMFSMSLPPTYSGMPCAGSTLCATRASTSTAGCRLPDATHARALCWACRTEARRTQHHTAHTASYCCRGLDAQAVGGRSAARARARRTQHARLIAKRNDTWCCPWCWQAS